MSVLTLAFPECYRVETEDGTVIYRDLPSYDDANYLAAEFTITHGEIVILRNRLGKIKGIYERGVAP